MKDDKEEEDDEQQPSQKKPKTLEEEAQARLANVYTSSAFAYEKQREDLALSVLATRTVPTERELIQLLDYATDGMIYVKDLLIIAAGYNEGFDRVLLYDEWRYVLPMKWNVADGDDMRVVSLNQKTHSMGIQVVDSKRGDWFMGEFRFPPSTKQYELIKSPVRRGVVPRTVYGELLIMRTDQLLFIQHDAKNNSISVSDLLNKEAEPVVLPYYTQNGLKTDIGMSQDGSLIWVRNRKMDSLYGEQSCYWQVFDRSGKSLFKHEEKGPMYSFLGLIPGTRQMVIDDRTGYIRMLRVWDINTAQLIRTMECISSTLYYAYISDDYCITKQGIWVVNTTLHDSTPYALVRTFETNDHQPYPHLEFLEFPAETNGVVTTVHSFPMTEGFCRLYPMPNGLMGVLNIHKTTGDVEIMVVRPVIYTKSQRRKH